jgi:uncharacterized protein YuzE
MAILEPTVQTVTQAVPLLLRFPMERFWVDYDKEADVLYISFRHPQRATDTRATEEGILLRYRGDDLVGITVLEASTRVQQPSTGMAELKAPATKQKRRTRKKKP